MKETKFLNCPFCGGEAFMYQTNPHESVFLNEKVIYKGATFIECAKCSCVLSGPTKEYVIKAWNTRIPMEKILERLKKDKRDFNYDNIDNWYMSRKEKEMYEDGVNKAIEIVKEGVIE